MNIQKILMLLLASVFCVFVSSCGKDDEIKPSYNDLEPKEKFEIAYGQNLIGKWVSNGSTYVDTYVFQLGGRGYRQFAYKDKGTGESPDYFSWEYIPETRVIKVLFDDEKEEFASGQIPNWAYSIFQVKEGYILTPDNEKCYKK